MNDYTPPTEHIRYRYWAYGSPVPEFLQATAEHLEGAAFDRWLAEVERAAAEKAWDAAGEALADSWGYPSLKVDAREMNPYRKETP